MRMAYSRKEEWAVHMQDLIEAVKCQARIAEDIYQQAKTDWLTRLIAHRKLETHGEIFKAGLAKSLKRDQIQAGVEEPEPVKSPRKRKAEKLRERDAYRREAMPEIAPEFKAPMQRILQEKDIPSKTFTIIRTSGEWCKIVVKGGVLNTLNRLEWAGQKHSNGHAYWATPS